MVIFVPSISPPEVMANSFSVFKSNGLVDNTSRIFWIFSRFLIASGECWSSWGSWVSCVSLSVSFVTWWVLFFSSEVSFSGFPFRLLTVLCKEGVRWVQKLVTVVVIYFIILSFITKLNECKFRSWKGSQKKKGMGWSAFGRQHNVMKSNLPLSLMRIVYN